MSRWSYTIGFSHKFRSAYNTYYIKKSCSHMFTRVYTIFLKNKVHNTENRPYNFLLRCNIRRIYDCSDDTVDCVAGVVAVDYASTCCATYYTGRVRESFRTAVREVGVS